MKVWKPKGKKSSAASDSKLALAAHHAQALEKITEEVMEPISEAVSREKKMSLLAPISMNKRKPANFHASDYGLTEAEGRQAKALMGLLGEKSEGVMLVQTSATAPATYNGWCSSLYAAATATWTPSK